MILTNDYTITDYQATPSGYYRISFRNRETGEAVTVTQEGHGGASRFEPRSEAFLKWLDDNAIIASAQMMRMGSESLAKDIDDRGLEWEDIVVMAIADLVELRILSVEG